MFNVDRYLVSSDKNGTRVGHLQTQALADDLLAVGVPPAVAAKMVSDIIHGIKRRLTRQGIPVVRLPDPGGRDVAP